MDKVFIIGHKKPDTDSVAASIALAHLKKEMGINAEARILSKINLETKYALNKFKLSVPKYLNDVKVEIKDTKYKKNHFVYENDSIYKVYDYLMNNNFTGIPIVNEKKVFKGYVSLKEICKDLISGEIDSLNATFDDLKEALNARKTYKFDNIISGHILDVSLPFNIFNKMTSLSSDAILIVGNRDKVVLKAINLKVKLIIITSNQELTKEEVKLAKENKVNIIITPYDVFKTSRLISLSNQIKTIQRIESPVTVAPDDYLSDFLESSGNLKHTNYPVVNSKGICEGMIRVIDTNNYSRKKVILVDHNDPSQSVDGLLESDILEIIDHHNIGNINTIAPINFRNMTVGSVNTIIYTMYEDYNIKLPASIAGIMLSGILSDTLILASPTTTLLDKEVAEKLAKICKLDIKKYGIELLSSGVSNDGLSISDIIYKDFKNYTNDDYNLGIGQIFTTSFKPYKDNINDYILELNKIAINNNLKVVCLFVTDILNNSSYVIYNEPAKDILKEAFDLLYIEEGFMLKGVISRKKQMLPLIMKALER